MTSVALSFLVFTLCLGVGFGKFGHYVPWKVGRCLIPEVKQDFDTEKYFTGHWYEQESFGNLLFETNGVCPTTQFKYADGEVEELDYHFDQMLMKYLSVRGSAKVAPGNTTKGYYEVSYKLLEGLLDHKLPVFVVDTDYENWALVYYCRQSFFVKEEVSTVLARKRTGWVLTDEVKEAMKKAGLKPDDYVKAKNVGCGPNEPSL